METPIRVLIADDNADMRRIERMMISRAEGFEIVGEAEDGVQLLTLVEQEKPQLVFLDVEMPGKTGVECARVIQDMNPAIVLIFATAHDEYMGDAFEVYAFDYLLKPFKKERVMQTLERAKKRIRHQTDGETPLPVNPTPHPVSGRLMLHHKDGVSFLNVSDIVLVQREDRTTVFYTASGERYVTSDSLSDTEARLDPSIFFRCHKSYIINLNHIKNITPLWALDVHCPPAGDGAGRAHHARKVRGIGENVLLTCLTRLVRCAIIETRLEETNRKFLTGWLVKTNRKEENMKQPVKKIISHLLMFALVLCVAIAPSLAESKPDCLQTISGENGTTYSNLFDVILSDDYDSVWEEHCKAIVGEENAAEAVEMLKSFISGDVYGDDAVALYGDGSEGFIFDCWYLNDVKSFTMNGDEITINKLDGTSETHKYRCIGTYQIGADETMTWGGETFCPAFDCEVYQATDDAGDFTYFFFRDDTMETTYHIEFRYGSDLAALQQYMKGQYAYWLAAGIDANADAETIDNVIALFCTENLSVEE